jgi:membrane-bound metal-dependent hydrolase YbcI (DUF457 family)
MADLFTHLAAARIPAAFLRDRRLQALLIAGTFLPDIVSKGLYWVARSGEAFIAASHSLLGLLLLCYAAAQLLDLPLRRAGFACLYAGSLVHLFLDLLKENLGIGALRPLLPFDARNLELGLIPVEDVVLLLPLDVALLALAWIFERRRRA